MSSELPLSADALLAERARLEEELQSSEDWCELLRLKSRKDRGEGMSAVNAARLEMVLIDALAEDPAFVRYKAVCVALERLIRGLPPLPPPARAKPVVEPDDLTQIKGITPSMARRLKALDVTTFVQIAEWRRSDIQEMSADLGIGRQIYDQNWIEQAEELATRDNSKPLEPIEPPARVAPPPPAAPKQSQPPVAAPVARPVIAAEKPSPPQPERQQSAREFVVAPVATKSTAATDVTPPPALKIAPVVEPAAVVAKPAPEPVTQAPVIQAPVIQAPVIQTPVVPARPLTPPPKPLLPSKYGTAYEPIAVAPSLANHKASDAAPLRSPPQPLRAEHYGKAVDVKPVPAAVSGVKPMPVPPMPLVITRASIASLPKAISPAPAPVKPDAPKPEPSKQAPPLVPPPSSTPPPVAKAAPATAAPTMSITEAIAYAAEVARQGQRPAANGTASRPVETTTKDSSAKTAVPAALAAQTAAAQAATRAVDQTKPQPPAKTPSAPPPIPAATRAAPPPPIAPPPLPAGFNPPEPVEPPPRARPVKIENPRNIDREDYSQRSSIEEATVEIVRKPAPVATPLADAGSVTATALEASLSAALEAGRQVQADAKKADAARAATPIGRFLKALTGN
ncbi:MAG: hypothetical protein ABL897_03875 [Hyphomicrobium sp.]